ncbi:glutamate--cysteine ligase [Gammaproteobacteria bacterium LSUCC0112]|nr:glutamate--cysteine ligase [Gammaproteobacteria bacterium LSUCC0112]
MPVFKAEWASIRRGIEKESLRVTPQGRLAQTPHPVAMGSALTHPYITTDYSEALIELITPVTGSADECIDFLTDIHKFTYDNLPAGERLWVSSMPCLLESEEQIPLAQYGSSNTGKLKTLYREGLGHRYSRKMQTIAGIHYNFSMPEMFWQDYRAVLGSTEPLQDFQTRHYLRLIRNYHRYSWLLVYLFGASPAVCSCFTAGREHDLETLDQYTLYKPYATCLRMGDLGYRSDAQRSIYVCYNDINNYIDSLYAALSTSYPAYEAIGLEKDGIKLQMNTNLLQLENEFYATIRPKRVGEGKRPLQLLKERGIQYVEVRALDLNPFLPVGINSEQIHFLDAFLLYCLLSDSPWCEQAESYESVQNLSLAVNRGREPGLMLSRHEQPVLLKQWANELLDDIRYTAAILDHSHESACYSAAVSAQVAKVENPELTPSAQILQRMREQGIPFCKFGMQASEQALTHFAQSEMLSARRDHFTAASAQSLAAQASIEAQDTLSFDEYLAQWNDYRL